MTDLLAVWWCWLAAYSSVSSNQSSVGLAAALIDEGESRSTLPPLLMEISPAISLSRNLSLSLSLFLSLSLSLFLSHSHSLSLSLPLSPSLSRSLSPPALSPCACLSLCLPLSLYVCVSLSHARMLTQSLGLIRIHQIKNKKGRRDCVKVRRNASCRVAHQFCALFALLCIPMRVE